MPRIVLQTHIKDHADISNLRSCKIFQNRDEIEQLVVMCVAEPTADGDSVLWVENVRCRRVIDDYGLFEISTHLRKVFDVVALVVVTTLSEQAVVDHIVYVELVEKRIAVL